MNLIILALVIVLGYIFINSFSNLLSENNIKTLKQLFFYHLFFGCYYCFFVSGDSIGYWSQAKQMSSFDFWYSLTEAKGTYFIHALNYFPSNILNLSYFAGTLLYSLIGFVGLAYFFVIAVELVPNDPKFKGYYLFPLLFFLPNLHFWSCAVGKDTLVFFCIAIFVYGVLNPYKRLILIVLGLVLSYFIRPHITLFMLLSFGIAYFSGKNISLLQRIVFVGLMIGVAVSILPMVLEFAKIEEASLDSFDKFSEKKAALLNTKSTDTGVDISQYSFPLKVFSFLYRPFFFDINGIPSLLASFENLLLLLISFTVLTNKPMDTFKNSPFVLQGLIYFMIIGTLAFSQSLGNIGIMIRMRNMFLPGLIIYFFWHFSYHQSKKIEP